MKASFRLLESGSCASDAVVESVYAVSHAALSDAVAAELLRLAAEPDEQLACQDGESAHLEFHISLLPSHRISSHNHPTHIHSSLGANASATCRLRSERSAHLYELSLLVNRLPPLYTLQTGSFLSSSALSLRCNAMIEYGVVISVSSRSCTCL